jgi:hypothetical protein
LDGVEPRVVWVLEELMIWPPERRFEGVWEGTLERSTTVEGPGWDSFREALAWARARAPKVRLRLYYGFAVAESVVYSAGDVPIAGLPAWVPESGHAVTSSRVDGFSGVAWISEEPATIVPQPTFRLVVEYTEDGEDVSEPFASGLSLEVAVERAREMSAVVVVGSWQVGHYSYMDVGREPYVRPRLPRFLG